ncbi:MAG: hypothetical protein WBQ71_02670 [Trebonia sp.]
MITQQRITAAYQRLLDRFGAPGEKTAPLRGAPLRLPTEADLMNRAIDDAGDSSAGTTDLRAALELAGVDQRNAETREINVVAHLRERGVSWREIAHHRGLQSAQAAKQRYERLARQPEIVIYAFRAADETGAPWHGAPDALPDGQYETGTIDFNPAAPRPYSGRTLELRYGPAEFPVMDPHLRAYALVNSRRVAATADVQTELFGG